MLGPDDHYFGPQANSLLVATKNDIWRSQAAAAYLSNP
jgi:hypothetical protein